MIYSIMQLPGATKKRMGSYLSLVALMFSVYVISEIHLGIFSSYVDMVVNNLEKLVSCSNVFCLFPCLLFFYYGVILFSGYRGV